MRLTAPINRRSENMTFRRRDREVRRGWSGKHIMHDTAVPDQCYAAFRSRLVLHRCGKAVCLSSFEVDCTAGLRKIRNSFGA